MSKKNLISATSLLSTLLALGSCTTEPAKPLGVDSVAMQGEAGDNLRRAPLYRLMEWMHSGPIAAGDLTCAIGNEIRPSLGCLPAIALFSGPLPPEEQGEIRMSLPIPQPLQKQSLILERTTKKRSDLDWRGLAPQYVRKDVASYEFESAATDDELLQIWARPLPPNLRHYRTRPRRIPSGATLQVGVGIAPVASAVGAAPVRMWLKVENAAGQHTLLDTRLSPATATTWQDHELDLQAYAGEEVSFHFISEVVGGRDTENFSAPLWGAPIVVAPVENSGPPSIIVISLDTLRSDYVGIEKQGHRLTPELDRFRETGAVFQNAMTTYPSTTGSHMSLFTGVYPATHETIHARKTLPNAIPTMAETLAYHGYATAAVTENAMLNAGSGFLRGFDSYQEQKGDDVWSTEGSIEKTFTDALSWLKAHEDERFFLFIHTYQVHFPYTPPERHNHFRKNLKGKLPKEKLARQAFWSEAGYAGEVLYMDAEVGSLLTALESLVDLENTIIVITSDHGEEFAEHGHIGHAETLHSEVLNIPMSIHYPGQIPPQTRVAAPASLVDILPTLLDFAGLPPEPKAQGVSLRPLIRGEDLAEPRAVYAQNFGKNGQQWAARTIDRKFIFNGSQKVPRQAYDLASDPEEKNPMELSEEDRAASQELIRTYKDWVVEAMTARMLLQSEEQDQAPAKPLDESVANKLRALGYMD
ncbi:MAG: sulfatase [Candidatus Binatia bacterium]|nr:sulfatase [Candidatus Binatia bacterium]MDG2010002.1 sulfatase [Candidatus Binatia bacterium]